MSFLTDEQKDLANEIAALLTERGETVCVAESTTGEGVGTLLTNWTNRQSAVVECLLPSRGAEDEADRADFVRRLGALAAETGTLVRKGGTLFP